MLDKFSIGFWDSLLWGAGAAAGTFVIVASNRMIKWLRAFRKKNTVPYQIEKAVKVQELLVSLRLKLESARTYIVQISNGSYYANTISILNMTCTHQSLHEGVAPVSMYKEGTLLTQAPALTSTLLREGCWNGTVQDLQDPYIHIAMVNQGVTYMIAAPFMDSKGGMEGFVVADYMGEVPEVEEACKTVREYAKRIGFELRS